MRSIPLICLAALSPLIGCSFDPNKLRTPGGLSSDAAIIGVGEDVGASEVDALVKVPDSAHVELDALRGTEGGAVQTAGGVSDGRNDQGYLTADSASLRDSGAMADLPASDLEGSAEYGSPCGTIQDCPANATCCNGSIESCDGTRLPTEMALILGNSLSARTG